MHKKLILPCVAAFSGDFHWFHGNYRRAGAPSTKCSIAGRGHEFAGRGGSRWSFELTSGFSSLDLSPACSLFLQSGCLRHGDDIRWLAVHGLAVPTVFFIGSLASTCFSPIEMRLAARSELGSCPDVDFNFDGRTPDEF